MLFVSINFFRRLFILQWALWLLFYFNSNAQTTKVSGKVTDELTGEPLPFVTVVFKGTTTGMNTDFNGFYSISTTAKTDSVVFRCVGYLPVTMRVKPLQTQVINVDMKVNKVQLAEAVVHAGEDPAIILFRKIQKNKDQNNRTNLDYYQYEVYNKIEFDLTNFDKLKDSKLIKPFSFIFDNVDSSETNRKPFLPAFISESISDYFYRDKPKAQREIIKASKISGLENNSVTQFLGDMYQNFNVYDNYLDLFNKSMVSPIASVGLIYYKYSLVDSATIGSSWCYKLTFKPKMKQTNTFIGEMWIHDTTFAVKKINMRIGDDININFIEDLAIVQEFELVNGTQWMKSKTNNVIQFAPREKGLAFIGRKTTSFKNIIINKEIHDSVFTGTDDIVVYENVVKPDSFWTNSRHDSLTEREIKIYAMVDTIKKVPAYRTWVDIFTLFVTGYKDIGKFELGPYYTFMSFNDLEGLRLKIGGRTSPTFSKNFQLEGYTAYGTKDGKFKYGGGIRYFLERQPRREIGLFIKNDIQQLGQSENAFQDDNILSSIFRRSPANKLTRTIGTRLYYEHEWFSGFSNKLTFLYAYGEPLGSLSYAYYTNDEKTQVQETITTSEITLYTRFLLKEKFLQTKYGRVSVGSKYPLIQLTLSTGLKGVAKSDFSYFKASIKVSDDFKLNPFGWGYYSIEAGQFFGQAPYPLLFVHPGNETYFYDYLAFSMMNYYEFISDRFVSVQYTHHFDGFFLDRIPLMRKLKWREVAQIKAIAGSLSEKNRDILVNPEVFSDLKKPYVEAGVGVENIFKIFRFDFLWRLTYNDDSYRKDYETRFPGTKFPPQFGIRGSFQLIF